MRMHVAKTAMAAAVLAVTIAGSGHAAVVTLELTPSADTTIFEESASSASGAGAFSFVGNTAGGVARRSLLRFDLSGVAPDSTVVSATLSIYVNRVSSGLESSAASAHRLLADWGEGASDGSAGGAGADALAGDATWSHRFWDTDALWASAGGDFAAAPSAVTNLAPSGASTWTGIGLAADVQAWIHAPQSNFGWILIGNEDVRSAHRFYASESTATSVRPMLRIEVAPIPEPSTYAMLGIGTVLVGLALGRRRRIS